VGYYTLVSAGFCYLAYCYEQHLKHISCVVYGLSSDTFHVSYMANQVNTIQFLHTYKADNLHQLSLTVFLQNEWKKKVSGHLANPCNRYNDVCVCVWLVYRDGVDSRYTESSTSACCSVSSVDHEEERL